MFRKNKPKKEGSLSSESPSFENITVGSNDIENKRNFKLFKFSKKYKDKNNQDSELPESPDSDGIRIDEAFQRSNDSQEGYRHQEKSSESKNYQHIISPKVSHRFSHKPSSTLSPTLSPTVSPSLSNLFSPTLNSPSSSIKSAFDSEIYPESAEEDTNSYSSQSNMSSVSSTENKSIVLDLNSPVIKTAYGSNESRTINVSRTKTGDFGIVLRRSSSVRKGDKRMIHLVEPTVDNLNVGLLPGDHLIALNGVNVENFNRKDIIGMIASSANTITLTVAPIAEYAEHVTKPAVKQNNNALSATIPSIGKSESPHSISYNKKKFKEPLSEKFLNGEMVWLVHESGYSAGQIYKETNISYGLKKYCVQLNDGSEIVDVDENLIEQMNPMLFNQCDKLSSLQYLNESSCLHTMQQRYAAKLFHTFADSSLIIVKPKEKIEHYSDEFMQMVRDCKQEAMPPHIFSIAQSAYRNMVATNINQSILFWGSAGSGKSFNVKKVVKYLCRSILKGSQLTVSKIEAAMFLVETFGSVKTNLSSNATTIRYLLTFEYNSSGFMIGCNMQNMFLGKSYFSSEESCAYHIFYYLLFSCKGKLKSDLLLDVLPKSTNLLINLTGKTEHLEDWSYLYSLMEILNFSENEILGIFAPLAAILHLGAAGISNVSETNFYFLDNASALRAALVLGTTVENLQKIIFTLPMQQHPSFVKRNSGVDSFASFSSSLSSSTNSAHDALLTALEAFCYGLYVESFNALFRIINRALNTCNRVVSKINVLDMPGLQDQSLIGKSSNFQDFCINYCCEKLQWFNYRNRFTQQVERYNRENIDCSFEINSIISPAVTISALEKLASDHISSKSSDEKLLIEEGVLLNVSEPNFVKNMRNSFYNSVVTTQLSTYESFSVLHYQNTVQVKYNAACLKGVKEHSSIKLAYGTLNESSKTYITELYAGYLSGVTHLSSMGSFANRRQLTNQIAASIKNSTILQLKLQMDKLIDLLEVSHVLFVFCLLPERNSGVLNPLDHLEDGKVKEAQIFDVPFIRQQLRSCHLLESMRLYRQGYPEHITYPEFRQRFSTLLQKEDQESSIVLDEKQVVLKMVTKLDLNEKSYKLGLSQIFFRAGCLTRLEDTRNDHLSVIISEFQSHCKGFLARIKFKKLVLQNVAIRCIQRNVRKYMSIRCWAWWRLFTKVLPLLQIHRTDEELQTKNSQIIKLNSKIEHLQEINNEHEVQNTRLRKKILDLTTELNEASTTASGADEIINFNSVEKVQLEEKLKELKIENESLRKQKELQQEQMLSTNVFSLNEPGNDNDFWQEKYKALWQSCEVVKRSLISEHEKEVEELSTQKRSAEKALYEMQSNHEETQEQMTIMKQKLHKLNGELQDLKLLLENEQINSVELEKKQRKFDKDIMKAKEEIFQEKKEKEALQKELEMLNAEIYTLQRSIALKDEENDKLKNKLEHFSNDDSSSYNTDELASLKKKNRENEFKLQDLEDEVDEQAGVIQQLEQTKVRLQMQNYNEKQKYQQDLESKDEEISQLRSDHLKKIRVLEEQLEEETSLKCELQRAKRELEKVVTKNSSNTDIEKKLKKKLKKTQILYNDTKTALDNLSIKSSELIELKALRNQLEDCEYTKNMALKAKSQVENDLKDIKESVENLNQSKIGLEEKCSSLARENAELLQRMEENDDGLEEVIRNNKNLISQVSDSQKIIINLKEDYRILLEEKTSLSRTVDALSQKLELELSCKVPKIELDKAEMKFRESENKLELETAIRIKAEHQVLRLKGQLEKLQDECDQVNKNLSRTHQSLTRVERQFNDVRNELEASKIQESEHKRKKEDLEKRLEIVEDELSRKRIEVTNTEKRVRELKEFIDCTNSSDEDILCDETDYI